MQKCEVGKITKRKRGMPKVMWLSPCKFVFESPSKMDFNYDDLRELGLYGKKKVLIVAEQGQDLRFLEGNGSMPDELCWFCDNGISPFLLSRGDVPSCLLGKHCGWVKFCKDFAPGLAFGQDKKHDTGERRMKAEKVLSKIVWNHCIYCEHRDTENVTKVYSEAANFNELDSKNAFCKIRQTPHHGKATCRKFKLSRNREQRARFECQKRKLQEYIRELKKNEKLEQRSTVLC